jgi:hypothetical protein
MVRIINKFGILIFFLLVGSFAHTAFAETQMFPVVKDGYLNVASSSSLGTCESVMGSKYVNRSFFGTKMEEGQVSTNYMGAYSSAVCETWDSDYRLLSSVAGTSTLSAGTYYIYLLDSTDVVGNNTITDMTDIMYAILSYDGNSWTEGAVYTDTSLDYSFGFNSVYNTRFTDIAVTGAGTVNVDAEYYLDGDEINDEVAEFNPTQVRFRIGLRPSSTLSGQTESISFEAGTSSVDTDFSGLSDGTYDLIVSFSNVGCVLGLSPCPFPESYVYTDFTISSGVLSSTGTLEFYDALEPFPSYEERACGLTELDGCIVNALNALFVPSSSAVGNFTEVYDTLETKFPFAYVYDLDEQLDLLYETNQTATATIGYDFAGLGTLTLISKAQLEAIPLSSTIRTILGYLLWLMFGLQVYNRSLQIFNTNPV